MERMKLKDQYDTASELYAQIASGIPVANVAKNLARSHKRYAEFWADAAASLANGRPLSSVLEPVWPQESVAALRAGEDKGVLEDVLKELVSSLDLQREVRSEASAMIYPAAIFVGAIVVFCVFLVTVIPMVAQNTAAAAGRVNGKLGPVAEFGLKVRGVLLEDWIIVVPVLAVAVYGLVVWLRSPRTKEEATRLALTAPLFGDAFRHLAFGMWCKYMAMACRAGLPTVNGLASTAPILPLPLQDSIHALRHDLDVKHVPLQTAADPEQQPSNDPRQVWPLYVTQGFQSGEQTGRLDESLARVSVSLIRIGKERMKVAMKWAYGFTVLFVAMTLGTIMLLVYLPMLQQLQTLR